MRPVWGKRAELKSLFFITVILVLAVIGATMSTGNYKFGQEAITGNAVASAVPVDAGFFGLLLALVALIAIVSIGVVALSGKSKPAGQKTGVPELDKVDDEISSLSRRLNQIDHEFGK
ncbi:hypothetical protein LDC_0048 [sediment metagenome]|uniref:Uncharacterized protein n=1 Tax=sediment metagenome TaxID=749907 RepID=D9PEX0_9ZZZZ